MISQNMPNLLPDIYSGKVVKSLRTNLLSAGFAGFAAYDNQVFAELDAGKTTICIDIDESMKCYYLTIVSFVGGKVRRLNHVRARGLYLVDGSIKVRV